MRKSISESIVVSGGNKGVSPGTPNIGGGREMERNVMLSDAEVKKGGKEMLNKTVLSNAVENKGEEMKNNVRLSVAGVNKKGGIKMSIIRKIERDINTVKELKLYIKNLKKAIQNEGANLEEYDFSKFALTERFDFFSREDMNMAILGISSAAVYNAVGVNTFMYDDNFMQLSEEAREFVYYHELGHVMLKHNEQQQEDRKVMKEYIKAGAKGQVHRFEYEADFFAARVVGRWQALTALEEVRGSLGPASSEVINKRIKAIFLSEYLD